MTNRNDAIEALNEIKNHTQRVIDFFTQDEDEPSLDFKEKKERTDEETVMIQVTTWDKPMRKLNEIGGFLIVSTEHSTTRHGLLFGSDKVRLNHVKKATTDLEWFYEFENIFRNKISHFPSFDYNRKFSLSTINDSKMSSWKNVRNCAVILEWERYKPKRAILIDSDLAIIIIPLTQDSMNGPYEGIVHVDL